jgi:hypothetical protein
LRCRRGLDDFGVIITRLAAMADRFGTTHWLARSC